MNIYLVPFTWFRHVAVSLYTTGAVVMTWWVLLAIRVWISPKIGIVWLPAVEGVIVLSTVAAVLAASSLGAETTLRRQAILERILLPIGAALVAALFAASGYAIAHILHLYLLVPRAEMEIVADPTLTSLRSRLLEWAFAGWSAGMGAYTIRVLYRKFIDGLGFGASFAGWWDHLGGGLASGLFGAAIWHNVGYSGWKIVGIPPNLYWASAFGLIAWGFTFGLLTWGVPAELYAGWIRVISAPRGAHRIPIDHADGKAAERFIGSFTRGLDLHLPAERGVAELHVSFVTDGQQNYSVRGLSQHHLLVKRPLERVDLRYDPRRPAPLETDLQPEDRLILGTGAQQTVLEFLLLPKEER